MAKQYKRVKAGFSQSQYQYLMQQSEALGLSLAQVIAACVDACQRQEPRIGKLYGAVTELRLHLEGLRAELERLEWGHGQGGIVLNLGDVDLGELLSQIQQLQRQWIALETISLEPEADLNQPDLEIGDDDC
ncbi:hypothetical protein [Leptolyngbya sp. PCC 6406]|uniref:hypothetical protein n=1 Tax=Leptolyngbya sp. PCC 6406 TaxID=1173264 RepID=UPI0002AC6BA1|nr:hypothetical protein [Leptolyngbya sp. PCC 6406]